jgi:hypothetical protein
MSKKKASSARKGTLNPTSKLSEEQVQAIRVRYEKGGVSHRALAVEFGVGKATVTRILGGKNWGWLMSAVPSDGGNGKAQTIQTADPEEWLANNQTFYCESLKARLTKAACRQNHEMAMGANQGSRRSGLLGHPLYESAAKDRLYHCGSCTHWPQASVEAAAKGRRKPVREDRPGQDL